MSAPSSRSSCFLATCSTSRRGKPTEDAVRHLHRHVDGRVAEVGDPPDEPEPRCHRGLHARHRPAVRDRCDDGAGERGRRGSSMSSAAPDVRRQRTSLHALAAFTVEALTILRREVFTITARFLDVSFAPSMTLIPRMRGFVGEFHASIIDDQDLVALIEMAAHELLETAAEESARAHVKSRVTEVPRRGLRAREDDARDDRPFLLLPEPQCRRRRCVGMPRAWVTSRGAPSSSRSVPMRAARA